MSTVNDKNDDASLGAGMRIIAPLLQASMQESNRITNQLMASNIQKAFRDGFEDGVHEGMFRQEIRTRRFLGVPQEKDRYTEAGYYLLQYVREARYPYDQLRESDIKDD